MFSDAIVLFVWGGLVFVVWSAISIVLTCAVIVVPAVLGWWRGVQWLSVLLVLIAVCLWLTALADISTGLPLPTRRKAGIVVMPIMALWPGLTALHAFQYRRTQRASAETYSQGDA